MRKIFATFFIGLISFFSWGQEKEEDDDGVSCNPIARSIKTDMGFKDPNRNGNYFIRVPRQMYNIANTTNGLSCELFF